MAKIEAYRKAEQKIEAARRSGVKKFGLNGMGLTELSESLCHLTHLQALSVMNASMVHRGPRGLVILANRYWIGGSWRSLHGARFVVPMVLSVFVTTSNPSRAMLSAKTKSEDESGDKHARQGLPL
jgi:hypothetical protein